MQHKPHYWRALLLGAALFAAGPAWATDPNVQGSTVFQASSNCTTQGNCPAKPVGPGNALHAQVDSSALPTGAATDSSLQSLLSKLNAGIGVTNFPSSFGITGSVAVTGTFWQATQPVSAASLPLPSGAATAANQTAVQSVPGTPQTSAVTVQGNAGGVGLPVVSGPTTPSGPDISIVTTGGVAVTAFSAGHCARGCIIINPKGATFDLCVNGTGTAASGSTTSGPLICIPPGQQYGFTARATAISAISADSAHAFGGEGYQ